MLQGKLTKLSANVNKLRTNSISGSFHYLPKVDYSFTIMDQGGALGGIEKELGGDRVVTTSLVKEVTKEDDNIYTFKTLNSVYELEVFEDDADEDPRIAN